MRSPLVHMFHRNTCNYKLYITPKRVNIIKISLIDLSYNVLYVLRGPYLLLVNGFFICLQPVGVNQAYGRVLSTHVHIADCKLDSIVHVGVCGCRCDECPVLFGPNDLCPTVFGCQAADSILSRVSRNESLRPFY